MTTMAKKYCGDINAISTSIQKTALRQKQCGAAVIVAILIVTLAASTAAFAVWEQSLWIRQLENITDRGKADQLAMSAIDIARNVLKEDAASDGDKRVDHLNENWAKKVTLPGENALVAGELIDQQGRFNLNNLIVDGPPSSPDGQPNSEQLQVFQRLLENLKLPTELATTVAAWVNTDASATVDLYYLSLDPPYRAAQREMIDIGELARLKGFDEATIQILSPYVTALKRGTSVNFNTASAELLSAMLGDQNLAKTIVNKRESTPYQNLTDIQVPAQAPCHSESCYTLKSDYFTVNVRVKSGRIESGYTALLDRTMGRWPGIKWRKEEE